MGLSETSGADIYDAGTIRCTNGALINVSGSATLPLQAAVPGDVTTATKQIDNKIFGTVRVALCVCVCVCVWCARVCISGSARIDPLRPG